MLKQIKNKTKLNSFLGLGPKPHQGAALDPPGEIISPGPRNRLRWVTLLSILLFKSCLVLAEPVIIHPDFDLTPSVSGDGKWLAFVSTRTDNRDIWLQDLTSPNDSVPIQLTNHPAADETPALNHDGSRLLYVSHATDPRGDLVLLDIKTGKSQQLTDRTYGETNPVWSHDESFILYTRLSTATEPQAIIRRNLQNSEETIVLTKASSCTFGPTDWLICASQNQLVTLQLSNPKKVIPLTDLSGRVLEPTFQPPNRLFFTHFPQNNDNRSTLWLATFEPGKKLTELYQLTSDNSSSQHPTAAANQLYYGNLLDGDLYKLDIEEFLKFYTDPTQARIQAIALISAQENAKGLLILGNLSKNPTNIPPKERLEFDLEYIEYLQEAERFQTAQEVLARHQGRSGAQKAVVDIHALTLPIYTAATHSTAYELQNLVTKTVSQIATISRRWQKNEQVTATAHIQASRLLLLTGDTLGALNQLVAVDAIKNKAWRVQALFARGKVYRQLSDETALQQVFIQVIRTIGEENRWARKAIVEAIAVTEHNKELPLNIAALRELLQAHPDLPHLDVAILMRIAQIYQDHGEIQKTVATLEEIQKKHADLLPEWIKSLWWQAEQLTKQEAFSQAASVYETLSKQSTLTPNQRAQADELMTQQLVASAIKQRDLGDVKIAAKLLSQILDQHPDSVEAHRGYITTKAMLKAHQEVLSHYEKLAKEQPLNMTLRYGLALAISYVEPIDYPRMITLLTQLTEQQPNVAYFHQTLAWAHEQYETLGHGERGHLEIAAQEYRTTWRLIRRTATPQRLADLMLNLGNVYFAMRNYDQAYRYFDRWIKSNQSLSTPLQSALLYRKLAESAFKSDHTQEAANHYQKVLDLIGDQHQQLRLETLERLGLAYQTLGEHAQAATCFSQALEGNLALKQTQNLALLQRNIGINLYQAALPVTGAPTGPIDRAALQEALASYLQSLDYLQEHGKTERTNNKGFINLVLSLGENGSQAALGFDQKGEEKLLFGFVSTAYEGLDEPEPALAYLQKKLALIPPADSEDAAALTERAVLLNKIGLLHFKLGQHLLALQSTQASLALTNQLTLSYGNQVNLYNLSKIAVDMFLTQEHFDQKLLEILVQQLQTKEWGNTAPTTAFYTLANTAFLLVNLPEIPLESPTGSQANDTVSGFYRLYDLKSRSDSLYRRAEALLVAGKGFTSRERLTNLMRIKLNRLVIARAAEKQAAAEQLTQEIEQLAASGQAETGWVLELLQAEANKNPQAAEAELAHTLKQAIALPTPLLRRGNGRAQAPFLNQLALLYTKRLLAKGDVKTAFEINEKITMRQIAMQLYDQLGPEFLLNGLGEQREEIADLLRAITNALAKNDQETVAALTTQLQTTLSELATIHPYATPWFQPTELHDLPAQLLTPSRPYLKVITTEPTTQLFLATGKEILHATLSEAGGLKSNAHFVEILSHAELLILSAPPNSDHLLAKLPLAKRPITRINTLYELIAAHPRQGLFFSRLATTGGVVLQPASISTELPMQIHPLTMDATDQLEQLNNTHLLLAHLPITEMAISLGEKNQVTTKLALDKLAVIDGHTAFLAMPANQEPTTTALLSSAFLHAGFAHIILYSAQLPADLVQSVTQEYLARLTKVPALLALQQAWDKQGKKTQNPFEFHGAIGLNPQEMQQKAMQLYNEELAAAVALQQNNDPASALRRVENGLALIKLANRMDQFTQLSGFAVETLFQLEAYPRAIAHQERLLAFIKQQQDLAAEAQALYTLGVLYSRLEQFSTAITHLEAAVKIWTKAGLMEKLAEGVATLGVIKENHGDYADALTAFDSSFDLFKKQDNQSAMAEQYLRMGRIYHLRLSRYQTAQEQFKKALILYQKLNNSTGEAKAHFDIGLTFEAIGDFNAADQHYQRGTKIATQLQEPLLMATGTLYQANTAWYQGEYQNAFQQLIEAQKLAEQANDPQLSIMIANSRGLIYWSLNENNKALLHLQKGIDLATKGEIPTELASSLNNKGLILRKMAQYDEALTLFQQAKAIDTKLQSRWGLAYDHRNIGITFMRQNRLQEAEVALTQAEAMSGEIADPINQSKALLELGDLNQRLQRPQQATQFYQRAVTMARKHLLKEVLWRATAGLGQLLRQQGQNEAALAAYVEAVQLVEGMRAALKIDTLRNSFQVDKQDLYKELILLLVDMGRERQAFDYLERFRSRNFIDLLANHKIALHKSEDEAALRQVNGLFQQLETQAQALAALKKPDKKLQKAYQQKLAAAEEAQLELQQRNPELNGFISVNPITLKQFEKLLEPDVGVLAYLLTDKELLIWLTKASGTHFKRVVLAETQLTETIRQYRDLMQNMEPVNKVMNQLYHWLIDPMADQLRSVRYLGIIPHNALHFLAFAALQSDKGALVEQFGLFYSPSASAMQYAFAKRSKTKRTQVLAIGNPDLGNAAYDLPMAEFEANSIRWSFPSGDALVGKKATKEWIVNNIANYGIIHIAAHGEFQNINPLFSSLWLASNATDKENNEQSGHLTVKEIFSLNLNADLVTLSACQTGLGKLQGSEMIGLNRAFLYAGTHSLISSLWRVDDLSTAVLMKHFYRNYVNMNKADSLRQAQLLVKQSHPHPANWAGFNLMGDYQ